MTQLSLAARPRRFSEVVGQAHVAKELQGYYAEHNDLPVLTMFAGPSGVGKTSLARLCVVSLECPHVEVFGDPCPACYRAFNKPEKYDWPEDAAIDLQEINCGDYTGIGAIRDALRGTNYAPGNGAKFRSYILDEFDSLTDNAQKLLKKVFEDSPPTTKFYVCTTAPDAIIPDILNRAIIHTLRALSGEEIQQLVEKLLTKSKSDLDPVLLSDLLQENHIGSARAITQAVTKYLSGATPEVAASLDGLGDLDTGRVCRWVAKGDWARVAPLLHDLKPEQARALRRHLSYWLKAIIIEDDNEDRRKRASKGIARMTQILSVDNSVAVPAVIAGIYDVTSMFGGS